MGGPDPNLYPVTPAEPPVGDGGRLAIGGRGLVGDYSTRTAVDPLGTLVTNVANGTYVLPPINETGLEWTAVVADYLERVRLDELIRSVTPAGGSTLQGMTVVLTPHHPARRLSHRRSPRSQAPPPTSAASFSSVRFVHLSFEGRDHYSRAGGLAIRVTTLAAAMVSTGALIDLYFVGDPAPGRTATPPCGSTLGPRRAGTTGTPFGTTVG